MGVSYELRPEDAVQMSRDDARARTEALKSAAQKLWVELVELYNRGAHKALGYRSWRAYCATEFQMGENAAYRLLAAGQVMDDLWSGPRSEAPPMGGTSGARRATRQGARPPLPTSERDARELRPVHAEEGPKAVRETWEQVVEEFGPTPTAAQTREVVRRNGAPKPPPAAPADPPSWLVRVEMLGVELQHIAKHHTADVEDHIDTALGLLPDVQADLEKQRSSQPF